MKNTSRFSRTALAIGTALTLSMIASCGGGGGDGSNAGSPPSTPNPPQTQTPVVATSGEIRLASGAGATVFWDQNGNWEADPWEISVEASELGKYEIPPRPTAEAVLRAQTRWLAPNVFGEYLGPTPLSAVGGQENVITPLTTLAQISGTSESQVKKSLGFVDVANATDSQLLTDVANAIAIQLRQRKGQLEVGGQTDAARAIIARTKQLIDEASSQQIAGFNRRPQAVFIAAASQNSISERAKNLPDFTKATYFSNRVSGFESYVWLTTDQAQRAAVSQILTEMQLVSKTVEARANGVIRFDGFDFYQLSDWVRKLTAAGIVRDRKEAEWDAAQASQKEQLL